MQTILTDDERRSMLDEWMLNDDTLGELLRKVEITVLSKSQEKKPQEFDYKHPRALELIGANARHIIQIDLIWQILEDPRREFTASDMEYWGKLHDKVQEVALAAAPEAIMQDETDAEKQVNCAEEILDGYAAHLDLEETSFECIGDYIIAVCEALKGKS